MNDVRRILGVDPGLRCTGFGIIECGLSGTSVRYLSSGVITPAATVALPQRIGKLYEELAEIIATYQPAEMAIEQVFVNINPQSTLLLGQARGALLAAAVVNGLEVFEYTALQVKQGVVGNGHASKEQVQVMVQRLLNLKEVPRTDPADALACALRHAHGGGNRLPSGVGKRGMRRWRVVPEIARADS
ncbi:MAG: crossover junction endodeoxyribonuclease RuvC [Betaproteobacteria bacterium]|nr:crossover junction endodeoxyribonuclease RuvC [Betaproteobacteria bacterium]